MKECYEKIEIDIQVVIMEDVIAASSPFPGPDPGPDPGPKPDGEIDNIYVNIGDFFGEGNDF